MPVDTSWYDRAYPTRVCRTCKTELPISSFSPSRRRGRIDRAYNCRPCHNKYAAKWRSVNYNSNYRRQRDGALRRQYKSSLGEFEAILIEQEYLCANRFCLRDLSNPTSKTHGPVLDHDHKTGNIRGILCWRCNVAFGFFDESADKLKGFLAYIERSG